MMKTAILTIDESREKLTEEQCSIIELSNTADDEAVSIARARVAPGVTTRWHRLQGIAERYVILEAGGLVEVADLPAQSVGPGDVVRIAPGQRQRIHNNSSKDLVFLAICTPRFRWEAYQDIDDAPRDTPALG
jgi:mannose-6-phosphate isomerase-like protein (cupin superfamily)